MDFLDALRSDVLVCDGAMGTELQKRGLASGEVAEWWNIERADDVRAIHASYVQAGARAILTNTFSANRLKLAGQTKYSLEELNRAGVAVARQAAGDQAFVLGNISSAGQEERYFMTRAGEELARIEQELYDAFCEQAVALAEAGVDALFVETMSALAEAAIAVRAATENTSLPVICSMTFRDPPPERPDEFKTYWKNGVDEIVGALVDAGASVLGSNCGDLVEEMPRLAAQMRRLTDVPLVFEINAGRPRVDAERQARYSLEPDPFAELVMDTVDAGADMVGGCCGTTPAHIAAIGKHLTKRQ